MVDQVPGVPEGYRLVRIGKPLKDEMFVSTGGKVIRADWDYDSAVKPIVEKIEPICTWPKGVFANGWIAKDKNGDIWWYSNEPIADTRGWSCRIRGSANTVRDQFLNPPVFKDGLPWTECVQQVGPEVENA